MAIRVVLFHPVTITPATLVVVVVVVVVVARFEVMYRFVFFFFRTACVLLLSLSVYRHFCVHFSDVVVLVYAERVRGAEGRRRIRLAEFATRHSTATPHEKYPEITFQFPA